MSLTACPYCARPHTDGGGPTREHVFVESLGGKATIAACRDCNSTIGHEVEGRLQTSQELLNLQKIAKGAGLPLRAEVGPDDLPVTYDFVTRELRLTNPVRKYADRDMRHFHVSGSPKQVRQQLERMKIVPADKIDELIAKATTVQLDAETIKTQLVHDVGLARRLVAKCALGASALAFGESFIHAPLAHALRDILWARAEPEQLIKSEALALWDNKIVPQGLGPLKVRLQPEPGVSQVVFMTPAPGRVAAVVHLGGFNLGLSGLIVEGELPAGDGLPVLVRDAPGAARVHLLVDDVAEAVMRVNKDVASLE